MTVSQFAIPRPVADVDAAADAVRAAGLRCSTARRLVLEALFATDRPLTAEEIAGGVAGRLPRSDLASVYRNLEALEAAGLVTHMHIGHSPGLYARAGAPVEVVVCERCCARTPLPPVLTAALRSAVLRSVDYRIRLDHFPLTGLCASCVQATATTNEEDEDDVRAR